MWSNFGFPRFALCFASLRFEKKNVCVRKTTTICNSAIRVSLQPSIELCTAFAARLFAPQTGPASNDSFLPVALLEYKAETKAQSFLVSDFSKRDFAVLSLLVSWQFLSLLCLIFCLCFVRRRVGRANKSSCATSNVQSCCRSRRAKRNDKQKPKAKSHELKAKKSGEKSKSWNKSQLYSSFFVLQFLCALFCFWRHKFWYCYFSYFQFSAFFQFASLANVCTPLRAESDESK